MGVVVILMGALVGILLFIAVIRYTGRSTPLPAPGPQRATAIKITATKPRPR